MDFLDPKKRRAYHIRLITGYLLVAIVIGLATYLITAGANGYGFNVKTGQIVQNGLVFVSSQPSGAEIYLNGDDQNSATSARLILPSGNYNLTLKKTGYRDWNRKFNLSEQSVARYVYPFLFPDKPQTKDLKNYAAQPGLVTQTPDQKWLMVESMADSVKTPTFDVYDTTTLDKTTAAVTSAAVPAGVLTNYSAASVLTEVEWSSNNDNLLLQHAYPGGNEFVVFDRAHPEQSFNVNSLFGLAPAKVSLYNKAADRLYLYNQTGGTLSLADVGAKTVAQPILKNVLAYKPYGKNLVSYITDSGEVAGQAAAKIWDSGQSYKVNSFEAGTTYLIDAAQFQDHFYYAAGSDKSDRINIYKDPESSIKRSSSGKALPTLALHDPGATKLSFSDNARFIGVEAGQKFAVYDIETLSSYQYPLSDPLAADMKWMDGHRFIGQTSGTILVMDYDGINKQLILPTTLLNGGFFSGNYNHLLTIAQTDDKTAFALRDIDTRAGTDLPKQ
jgi:hypothetical protein